jgi:hypothetical protein
VTVYHVPGSQIQAQSGLGVAHSGISVRSGGLIRMQWSVGLPMYVDENAPYRELAKLPKSRRLDNFEIILGPRLVLPRRSALRAPGKGLVDR